MFCFEISHVVVVESVLPSVSLNFWSMTSESEIVSRVFAHLEAAVSAHSYSGGRFERIACTQRLVWRLLAETYLFFDDNDRFVLSERSVVLVGI